MDRASDYGSEGWGFDSLPARYQGKRSTPDGVIRTGLVEEPQGGPAAADADLRLVRVLNP